MSWPEPSVCRRRRCASSATTSRRSRARTRSAAWSSSRRAVRAAASTAASGCGPTPSRQATRTTSRHHREVLRRRFYRALEAEEGVAEELRWRLPDLVVIDGGLGQVNVGARGARLAGTARTCPRSAWPRNARRSSCPGLNQPLVLPANSQALYLLQRLRDEAHRFAITYHRKLRAKAQTRSVLDEVPGVGPARKRALLRVFGSTKPDALRDRRPDRVRAGHQPRAGREDPSDSIERLIAILVAIVPPECVASFPG